jgi:Plus-3 domain
MTRYGNAERVYRLEFVSNSEFDDSEFAKWKETIMLQGLTLPTMYDVEQKLKDITLALDYKFNDEDVDMVGVCKVARWRRCNV